MMQTSAERGFLTALDFFFCFSSISPCALTPFLQRPEFHVVEPHSTDVCVQLDTESPGRAPGDVPSQAGSVRWIQVSGGQPLQNHCKVFPVTVWSLTSDSSPSCWSVAGATATILAIIHWVRQTLGRSWRMSFPTWKHADWAWEANPNILSFLKSPRLPHPLPASFLFYYSFFLFYFSNFNS